MEILIIAPFIIATAWWWYLHWAFREALKNNEPDWYNENSGWSPLKYSAGIAWIDVALSGKYKQSPSSDLKVAGDRLVTAYEYKAKVIGWGFFAAGVLFLCSLGFHKWLF